MAKLEDTAPDVQTHMKLIVIPTIRHAVNLRLHCPKAHCTLPAVHPVNWDRGYSSMFFPPFSFRGLSTILSCLGTLRR